MADTFADSARVEPIVSSGPPPPPPSRSDAGPEDVGRDPAARRRRRRVVLTVLAAVVVIGTPVGLAIAAAVSAPAAPSDEPAAGATGAEPAPDGDTGPGTGEETDEGVARGEVRGPDPDELQGRDATWARLLRGIDESEQAMMAFQERLEDVAGEAQRLDDPEAERLLERVRDAAEAGARRLAQVRPRLAAPIDDGRVEEVRASYVVHHDAWADYLDAVAGEPELVAAPEAGAQWRLSIDASGQTFAQQLRAALDGDIDHAVRAFAQAILRRGFDDPAGTVDT